MPRARPDRSSLQQHESARPGRLHARHPTNTPWDTHRHTRGDIRFLEQRGTSGSVQKSQQESSGSQRLKKSKIYPHAVCQPSGEGLLPDFGQYGLKGSSSLHTPVPAVQQRPRWFSGNGWYQMSRVDRVCSQRCPAEARAPAPCPAHSLTPFASIRLCPSTRRYEKRTQHQPSALLPQLINI